MISKSEEKQGDNVEMPNEEDLKPSDAKGEPSATHSIKISAEIQDQIRVSIDAMVNRFIMRLPYRVDHALFRIMEDYLGLDRGRYSRKGPLRQLIESKTQEIAFELLQKVELTVPEDVKEKLVAEAQMAYQTELQYEMDRIAKSQARSKAKELLCEFLKIELEFEPKTINFPDQDQIHNPDYGKNALEKAFLEHELRNQK